jgi:hypothetical protein
MIRRIRCGCGANLFFVEVSEAKSGAVLRCCNCHKMTELSDGFPSAVQNANIVRIPEDPSGQLSGMFKTPGVRREANRTTR